MKPYIICHMLSSVDGKIDGNALDAVIAEGEYEATGAKLEGDAWICGRTTMQRCSSTLRRMSRSSPPRTRRPGRSPSSSLAGRILMRSLWTRWANYDSRAVISTAIILSVSSANECPLTTCPCSGRTESPMSLWESLQSTWPKPSINWASTSASAPCCSKAGARLTD
jgi:hypothetical protein